MNACVIFFFSFKDFQSNDIYVSVSEIKQNYFEKIYNATLNTWF